jgi:MtN3 and saliva related transmembrane protein
MLPAPPFDPSWIGFMAAILTTVSFAPQAIKAWRTRSTQDVSLTMFVILVAGIMLWLTYGLLIDDAPLIIANAVTLALAGAILVAKIRFH